MAEWSGDDIPYFGASPPPYISVTLGLGSTIVVGAWASEPKKCEIF